MDDDAAVRRATALVVAVICLQGVAETAYGTSNGGFGETPLVVALAVLPLLYVVPATRPWWRRHRYWLLGIQVALTYLPFAVFGGDWAPSGWLAGLVLLTLSSPTSWFVVAFLGAIEVALWSGAVVELPYSPSVPAAVWSLFAFVFDGFVLFGLARLTDLIKAVHAARDELAESAVTAERVTAADRLRAAIGNRLTMTAGRSAAALQAIAGNPALAREHIAAAAVTAREALSEVRAVAASYLDVRRPEPTRAEPGELPAPRLAQAILAVMLCIIAFIYMLFVADNDLGEPGGYGTLVIALTILDAAALVILQLRHSWPSRSLLGADGTGSGRGRPRGWPATLLLQAVLLYALVPATGLHPMTMAGFLAGTMPLLVPGLLGWAGFAVVIASVPMMWSVRPPVTVPPMTAFDVLSGKLYLTLECVTLGLLVYGLTRLAQLAVQLESLRGELAREAVADERVRLARDTHDLLGLGLSAVAMKSDLIGKLIGRDDARAGEEIAELARICAAASADVRLVAGEARELPLDAELATARDVLVSAGIDVQLRLTADPPPETAAMLVPVVREAVTNILKHSSATHCTLELSDDGPGRLCLQVSNDGVQDTGVQDTGGDHSDRRSGAGNGLRNLAARLDSAGGELATRRDNRSFILKIEIPLGKDVKVNGSEPA
jgi:two-component system, NarL family, sensor histidine kinase DesK